MPLYALDGVAPQIDPDVGWIAPSAVLVGDIVVGAEAGIWFGVVARGDIERITIGARTNVQENCVLHTDSGYPLDIGDNCTIGHGAIVHGCTIGDNTLIGMGATVLNGARIGRNCLIGANTLITEGKEIPDNSMVVGAPGKVVRTIDAEGVKALAASAERYVRNARRFAAGLVDVTARPGDFEPA
jgi:carbonic anhydrase/acetyltransferase-like protein (isoleucine patch superfamily)